MAPTKRTKAELIEELKVLRAHLTEQERARAQLESVIKELAPKTPAPHGLAKEERIQDTSAQELGKLQNVCQELQAAERELRRRNEELLIARLAAERDRNRYQDLFEFTPDGYLISDAGGVIREANRLAETLLNVPRQELSGKPLMLFIAAEQREEFMSRLSKFKESGKSEKWELLIQPQGREAFYAELTVVQARGPFDDNTSIRWLIHDITERKQAEQALREHERDLNRAQAVSRTGSWRMNVRKNELLWSEETYRLFRVQQGTPLTYESFLSSVHPDDRAYVDRKWRAALTGEPYDIEHRIVVDERVEWVRERAELEFDEEGSLLGGFGTVQDITELKQAEEALRESEDRYRTLFESIDQGFCIIEVLFDASGKPVDYRFLEANPAFEGQTGLRDAVGRRMRELEPRHEEHWFETYGRIALAGEPERFTNEAKHLDNRWYDVYAFRVGQPKERKVAILFNDITKRRRAEEKIERQSGVLNAINRIFQETLRSETEEDVARICLEVAEKLTGSAFGFVGEINEEGAFDTIALSDPGWAECRMLDSEKAKMITGMKIRGYWSKPLIEGRSLIVNDPADHPERVGVPEGHPPITSFLGVPFKRDGKTTGMIGLANKPGGYALANQQDVEALAVAFVEALERKRGDIALRESETRFRDLSRSLEETVKQKTAELVQAEHLAAIGQMVSILAHEVRNPIHVIRTGLDTLREMPHDEHERRQLLEEIEYGAKMLEGTIFDLLQYSRPLKLEFSFAPVKDVVKGALKLLANKIKNISTSVELERGDEKIQVDVVKFTQVLVNIISNAADAMPDGGSLRIRSRFRRHGDAKLLEMSISDTGHGIEEKHMDDILKPFFTTKTRGTGLGLPLCKKILDAHNGTISIKSKVGKGTVVELTLPIRTNDNG